MTLPKEDACLFFKLYIPLLGYANHYDGKNRKRPLNEARDLLYANPKIIKDFLAQNPHNFSKEELALIADWRRFIMGDFILIKSFKKYGVLLSTNSKKARTYGVIGLTDSVADMATYGVGTYFARVVLLPWKDRIIWDGLFYVTPLIIGKNYMRSFTAIYEEVRQTAGIIEHL